MGPFFYISKNKMKFRILHIVICPLFLLHIYSCQQSQSETIEPSPTKLDSLNNHITLSKYIHEFRKDKIDSSLLKAILKKSNLFDQNSEYDSVLKYDRLLLKMATKANDRYYLAKAKSYLAYDFKTAYRQDSAFYYYQKSKNDYKVLHDSTQVGKKLLEMGKIQFQKNDYHGAKESITEALIFLNNKYSVSLVSCWNELGNIYMNLNDFKNAESFYLKAIEAANSLEDKSVYQNNLAILFMKKKEYEKAIELLNNNISNLPKNIDQIQYARLLHNRAEAKWNVKQSNTVLNDYITALELRRNNGDSWGMLSSYRSLAQFYLKKKPHFSRAYTDSLIILSKRVNIPEAELEALEILFKSEPNQITHRERYIVLKDSLDTETLNSKNHFAYLKYQDQQEKTRLLELETETAQKEAQLAQQEIQKILFLSLSAILLMGGISLYFVLKQRHKKERLQEVYNTEKRIAQEIHDSLSNDVFSLMTKVQNEKTDTEEFLGNLEHIYKTSRQISHDNSEIQTGTAFESELKNLINTYHGRGITVVTKGMNDIDWSLLSEHKCIALHRTINEILVNMRKHSQASLVSFTFEQDKGTLLITYTDNGVGIDPQKPKGIGLKNTVSRMNAIGSVFKFVPKSFGPGVKAEIAIPI